MFDVAPPSSDPITAVEAVWNGFHFVVSTGAGLVRVTAAGVVLDPKPHTDSGSPMVAALDDATNTLATLSVEFSSSVISAGPSYYAAYSAVQLDPSFRVQSRQDRGWTPHVLPPALAAGNGNVLTVFFDWYTQALYSDLVDFDGERLPYAPPPIQDSSRAGIRAVWNGGGFLVASAATLARHAPDGSFRDKLLVGENVRDSAVAADGTHAAIVLATRGVDQMTVIEASRWELP